MKYSKIETMRTLWSIPLLLVLLSGVVLTAQSPARDGSLVLFAFDTVSWPWRENLKLQLERPKKHPVNPVLKSGAADSVDGYGAALYGTVLHIGGKLRMWYLAWPQPDSRFPGDTNPLYRPVAYAESTDGVHWNKPELNLVSFRGSKRNNIVLIEPASEPYARTTDFISVLYDVDDPDPARRFKMAYIVEDYVRKFATTATAVSPDGLRWKLVNTEPVTRGHFENTSLIRYNGLYYAGGQNLGAFGGHTLDGTMAGRTFTVFFSPDFKHWSGGRALAFERAGYVPKPEAYGQEAHMGAGVWNRGNVILGLYGRWYGDTITGKRTRLDGLKIDLGLLVSNDAIHYREPVTDFVFLETGKPGEWDSIALLQGNAFHNTETETQIWYSHWNTGGPWPVPALPTAHGNQFPSAIGLATLPRDRFGCVSKLYTEQVPRGTRNPPVAKDGLLISRSIHLAKPAEIYVNAEGVSDATPLSIDLVDDNEQILAGYTAEITTASLGGRVRWSGGKLAPTRPFRIRVRWPAGTPNPKLYAVYVGKP